MENITSVMLMPRPRRGDRASGLLVKYLAFGSELGSVPADAEEIKEIFKYVDENNAFVTTYAELGAIVGFLRDNPVATKIRRALICVSGDEQLLYQDVLPTLTSLTELTLYVTPRMSANIHEGSRFTDLVAAIKDHPSLTDVRLTYHFDHTNAEHLFQFYRSILSIGTRLTSLAVPELTRSHADPCPKFSEFGDLDFRSLKHFDIQNGYHTKLVEAYTDSFSNLSSLSIASRECFDIITRLPRVEQLSLFVCDTSPVMRTDCPNLQMLSRVSNLRCLALTISTSYVDVPKVQMLINSAISLPLRKINLSLYEEDDRHPPPDFSCMSYSVEHFSIVRHVQRGTADQTVRGLHYRNCRTITRSKHTTYTRLADIILHKIKLILLRQ